MLVRWNIPASEGAVKLNVDGSSRGNPGRAGCGSLLRDEHGNWILGFSGFTGITNSLLAELIAIRHGLSIVWDLGFQKAECESDCLHVVHIIYSGMRDFDNFYIESILEEIDELMLRQWDVKIYHVHREANSCADFLAKIGSSSCVPLDVMSHPPVDILPLLLADSKGVCFSRA